MSLSRTLPLRSMSGCVIYYFKRAPEGEFVTNTPEFFNELAKLAGSRITSKNSMLIINFRFPDSLEKVRNYISTSNDAEYLECSERVKVFDYTNLSSSYADFELNEEEKEYYRSVFVVPYKIEAGDIKCLMGLQEVEKNGKISDMFSYAGGKRDYDDPDVLSTGLREFKEELGLYDDKWVKNVMALLQERISSKSQLTEEERLKSYELADPTECPKGNGSVVFCWSKDSKGVLIFAPEELMCLDQVAEDVTLPPGVEFDIREVVRSNVQRDGLCDKMFDSEWVSLSEIKTFSSSGAVVRDFLYDNDMMGLYRELYSILGLSVPESIWDRNRNGLYSSPRRGRKGRSSKTPGSRYTPSSASSPFRTPNSSSRSPFTMKSPVSALNFSSSKTELTRSYLRSAGGDLLASAFETKANVSVAVTAADGNLNTPSARDPSALAHEAEDLEELLKIMSIKN